MQKAVVSTSIGVEGINITNGKDILVADQPEEFANAVIKLLKDDNLRESIGINARQIVEREHSWSFLSRKLQNIFIDAGKK